MHNILNIQIYVFCQIWGISSQYFFKYFFSPPSFSFSSGVPMAWKLELCYSLNAFKAVFQSIFSVVRVGNFYYSIFSSIILSSVFSILLLKIYTEFLFWYCTFQFWNFHLVLLYIIFFFWDVLFFSLVSSMFLIYHWRF